MSAAVCLAVAAPPPTASRRETATQCGLTLEYPAGDEAFARTFAIEFSRLQTNGTPVAASASTLSIADMKQRRTEFLDAICHQLHLPKPTAQMTDTYEKFILVAENLRLAIHDATRRFQVWRGPELKARLEAGESIPGIKLGQSGAIFSSPQDAKEFSHWALPVMLTSRDTETGEALAQKKAREAHQMSAGLSAAISEARAVHLLLHETVEWAIVENYLNSADRRWFCEGVANYVASKVIEERVGAAETQRYYDLEQQLGQYADLRAAAHLEKWAALEDQLWQNHDDRQTREGAANYVFATEAIFQAAAGKGPDFLPALFGELGKTPLKKAGIKTVYRAYRKLYREDLRRYLPNHR